MRNIERLFRWSVVLVLILTAAAKLLSAGGRAPVLDLADPLFGLSNRQLLVFVGMIEVAVAAGLLSSLDPRRKYLILAWLASNFMVYRISFYLMHPGRTCPCLGSLTERLHMSDRLAGMILSCTVIYLLIGSLWMLVRSAKEVPALKTDDLSVQPRR